MYEMPAYRVNEALACHWISEGIAIEKTTAKGNGSIEALEKLRLIKSRPKPKFNF
jgi:hypothetical protein